MRVNERMKKVFSILLCVLMLVQYVPTTAFAVGSDNLCEHHATHTAECGYAEAVAGSDCTHIHDGSCGYVEPVAEVKCACEATDENGALVHTEGCGYVAPVEGSNCTHAHDEACGYVAAVEAHECHYECAECAAAAASEEAPEESSDPAPVCDCGTDDPAIHATTCAVYVAPENPQCYCAEKCTEANVWCDVCGFDYTACTGTDRSAGYGTGWEIEGTTLIVTGHLTALPEGVEYSKIEVHEGGNLDLGEATVTCDVDNYFGTISSGTFNTTNLVSNYSIISGGTFHDDVNNEYGATISGGTFTKEVRNDGTISGGDFISCVINKGTITGGTIWYGTVTNKESGTISNAKFESNAKLAEGSTPPQSVIHCVNGEDIALTYNAELPAALGEAAAWYQGDTQVTGGSVPLNYTTYVGEYTITTEATTNGTVSVPATAKYGQTVTVTATASEGYVLDTVTVQQGETAVTVTDNAFTMPAGDVTVSATFKEVASGIQAGYYLVGTLNGENKLSVDQDSSDRLLKEDTNVEGQYCLEYTFAAGDKLKIAYFDGQEITKWYKDDDFYPISDTKAGKCILLFRPEGNDIWSFTYFTVTPAYSVTVNTVENGAVTADKAVATADEAVTLKVTPAEGYEIDTVSYNDGADHTIAPVEGVYSFTMPAGDVTVSATFTLCDHSGSTHTAVTDNGDGTHSYTCACGATVTEAHTMDIATGKCSACGADMTAIATVTDGTNTYYAADAATLNQAVTAILETGSRTFTVELPADTEAEMITAIRRAICDTEGVADGSIHLTLKGVTSIPGTTNWDGVAFGPRNAQWDENNVEIVSHEEVTQLASVNLPDVTEIGAQAFLDCSNLTSITAPKVQSIGDWGLQGTAITSIDMPLLKEAGYSAFCRTALTEVSLPSLETAGVIVFGHCEQLRTVDLPKLQNLSQQLFTRCTSLVSVSAPAATSMGINVFKGCSELVSITLPGVTELTNEAFAECTKLENITLGSVITKVNVNLFAGEALSSGITLTLNCGQKNAETLPAAAGTNVEWAGFTWKEVKFAHSYVNSKCTVCGEDCTHTGGTATCTTLAVCDICKTAYGELGGHTYNTAGSCTVCGAACPHSNFDPATGNCKDCETSLAIAKIKTGETTTYYQTADDLRTAVLESVDDQTITLLADFEMNNDLDFNADGTENILDLNEYTLTGSSRIDVASGELTITGPGSINIFMTADNEGAKIVVGSGVTLNDTLRSVYGGILDLTGATIPEAGLNVILYSDDSDPTTYNVSDVLLLPADYYFFVDGKAVYTYSVETEGTVLKHTDHSYTYTDNGDGTHDATCSACGKMVDNEAHTFDQNDAGEWVCDCTAKAVASVTIENLTAYYANFADAVTMWAEHGDILTLLADVSYDSTINLGVNVSRTFVGGDYTLDLGSNNIVNYGTLTIQSGTIKTQFDTALAVYGPTTINSDNAELQGKSFQIMVHKPEALSITGTGCDGWRIWNNYNTQEAPITIPEGFHLEDEDGNQLAANDKLPVWEITVIKANHVHNWSYTADGNTITATCNAEGCPDAEQSFTLNAPDVGYSGNPVEAEVTRDGTDITYTLRYTGTNYDSADAPTNAGDYTVTMTVGDKSVSDTFTISSKDISKVASCQFSLTQTSFVYSGKAPVLNVTGVDSSVGSYTMQEGTDYTVGTVQVNAGSHKLTVTGIGNYTGTVELDYTITAKEVSITGAVIQPVTYNPNGYTLTVTGVTFDGVVDGETLAYTAEATLGNTNAVGEQDATVTVTLNNSNYNLVTATYQTKVTINKAAATVTAAPTPNDLTYTGEAQYLLNAGEANGGTMQYSTDNQTWSTTIPQGTDAGKYTVYYKVVGDENHSDTAVDSIEVTIAKAQAVITVDTTTITVTYGETVSLPTATTNFGTVVCDKTADDLVNAGTYTVTYTVAGTENFEGATKTLTVKVEQLAVAEPTVTGTYTYTGKELTAQLTGVESYMTVASGNKGTNAGNYEVEVTLDGNHKWADGSDGRLQWTIAKAKAEIRVNTDPITITYGETVTLPNATTNFGDVACSKKVSDIVNAGSYTVTYTVAGTDNYDGDTKPITVIVNAKAITVTADAVSKTYGDTDPTLTYTAQGLVNGDELTGELKRAAGENIGSYAIEQNTLTAGNNYSITYTGANLTINAKAITEADVELNGSLTYTGEEQTQPIAVTEGITYEVTGNKATNVGTYELTVKGIGNYTGEVKLNWSIKEAAAVVGKAPTAKELTYTGTAQALVNAGTTADGKLVYSLSENGEFTESIPTGTNAGEYTVWYYVQGDDNHSDTAKASVKVTIAKADPVIGTVGCGMDLYDSTAISNVELTRTDMSVDGILVLTDSELTAGEGTYNWKFTPKDTDNYNTITGTVVLNVTADVLEKIEASGNLEKDSYSYGDTFTIDGLTVTATYTTGATKDVTELVNFDSNLAVGQPYVELTYQGKTCTVTGFTVAKKQLVIDRMAWDIPENAVYNGTEYTATLNGTLPTGVVVTLSGDKATNAGSYTAKAVFSLAEGYSADNYEIVNGEDLTADWTIAKKNIVGAQITLGTALTYNGKQQTQAVVSVKIDGLSVTYTVSGNTGTDAKGYTLTITGSGNFEGTATADWSIAKRNISGAMITLGDSLTYNGNEQTQEVADVKIGDLTVTYDVTANKQLGAGNYTLIVTGNGNFEGSVTADWSIAKAKATITVDTTTINVTYGETVTLPIATTNFGAVACDKTAADLVNAGSYTVTYTVAGTANYEGDTKTLTVIVAQKAVAEPTVTDTYTYTGSEQTVTLTGVESCMSITSGNKATNAGNYEVVITLDSNHKWADGSDGKVQWSIGNAEFGDVYVSQSEMLTYNGTAQTPEVHTDADSEGGQTATFTYRLTENESYGEMPAFTDAGTYTIYFKASAPNHNDATGSFMVTVDKAKAEITVDTNPVIVTYGDTVELPDASANFGTVTCDKTVDDLVNVGTYTVTYTVVGTDNYDGDTKTLTVTINAKAITEAAVELNGSLTYTGEEQTQPITVTEGITYTVTGDKATNVGSYVLTVKGTGNYTGSVTLDWTIAKAKLTITADSKVIYIGEKLPTLTYTAFGLVGGDKLTKEPVLTTNADADQAGSYTITAANADAGDNYTITYVSGSLTIMDKETEVETKIEQTELTEVPDGLKDTEFNTVEAITEELISRILAVSTGFAEEDMVHYDVTLQFSLDDGETWIHATEENFPTEGITVILPYPEGTNARDYEFVVSHMFTVTSQRLGTVAGEVEMPKVEETENGIRVTLNGLSPVTVAARYHDHTGGVATCTDKAICSICGNAYGELDSTNHAGGTEVKNAKEATCGAEGYTGDTHCKGCGEIVEKGTTIKATGEHTYGDWKVVKEPTKTTKGEKQRTCSVCGHVDSKEIPVLSDTPATGDDSNIMLYSSMFTVSLAGLVVLLLAAKKRKQETA